MSRLHEDRIADDQQEDEENQDGACRSEYIVCVSQGNHLLQSSGVKTGE